MRKTTGWILAAVIVAMTLTAMPRFTWADEETAPSESAAEAAQGVTAPELTGGQALVKKIKEGGWTMAALLLLSIAAGAPVVETAIAAQEPRARDPTPASRR